jgi:hypothetical protein
MGHLISAGTGLLEYQNIGVEDPESEFEDELILSAKEESEIALQQEAMLAEMVDEEATEAPA